MQRIMLIISANLIYNNAAKYDFNVTVFFFGFRETCKTKSLYSTTRSVITSISSYEEGNSKAAVFKRYVPLSTIFMLYYESVYLS